MKERELLKTILAYMAAEYLVMTEFEMITQIEDTIKEIQELLAQPEQDNIQYLLDQVARLTVENAMLKEKWSTPKREPLSDKEIHAYLSLMEPPFLWDEGFCSGIEWAEKQHGIGGGE